MVSTTLLLPVQVTVHQTFVVAENFYAIGCFTARCCYIYHFAITQSTDIELNSNRLKLKVVFSLEQCFSTLALRPTCGLRIFEMGLKFYWAYIWSQEKCMAEIYNLSAEVNL